MKTFIITNKTKRKARRRRQRNEKKWIVLRVVLWIFSAIWPVSFYIGIFKVPSEDYERVEFFGIVFCVSLLICAVMVGLLINFTSHWIQDRLNERLWSENGILYHFIQIAFACGLNSRSADSRALLYEYDIASIRNAKYDPKSGRLVFHTNGRVISYRDYYRKIIEKVEYLNGATVIFYEYMEPCLYTYLESEGVKFSLETLKYKAFDPHI